MTSNVLYDENMRYEVAAAVSDCLVIISIIIIIITSHRVVVEPPLNLFPLIPACTGRPGLPLTAPDIDFLASPSSWP